MDGWEVKVEFNKNFSKINFFNGLTQANSGNEFLIANEAWSGNRVCRTHRVPTYPW